MRRWLSGRRGCLAAVLIVLLPFAGCAALVARRVRQWAAPKRLQTLDLIEQRTEWDFPPETRIVAAAQDNLGTDLAIWAVLQMPRDEARRLLTPPLAAQGQGELSWDEGQGEVPRTYFHVLDYWHYAPDWIPPLPGRFEHYLAASRFDSADHDVREAVVELGNADGGLATVYVFYTTY